LTLNGRHSKKKWFKVADLSGTADEIIVQTVAFVTSCATARYNNFGSAESRLVETFSLGLSEKGKTYIANYVVGSREVQALHGFVWEALKNNLGDRLVSNSMALSETQIFSSKSKLGSRHTTFTQLLVSWRFTLISLAYQPT
jgi:hypothetical protein